MNCRREVFVTNRDKVMAINQLSGDNELAGPWGFGKRRVRGACTASVLFDAIVYIKLSL